MTSAAKHTVLTFGIDAIVIGEISADTSLHHQEVTLLVSQLKSDLVLKRLFHQMLQAVESRAWNSGMLLSVLAVISLLDEHNCPQVIVSSQ